MDVGDIVKTTVAVIVAIGILGVSFTVVSSMLKGIDLNKMVASSKMWKAAVSTAPIIGWFMGR